MSSLSGNMSNNFSNASDTSQTVHVNILSDWESFMRLVSDPHDMIIISMGLVAVLLNSLILFILKTSKKRLTSLIQLIISLAVSDVLVAASATGFLINKSFNPIYPNVDGPTSQKDIFLAASLCV